jgi:hypothetical protein
MRRADQSRPAVVSPRAASRSADSVSLIPSGVSSNAQGQNQRAGKSEREQHDDEANGPVRNLQKRKDLRRDLHEQPCNHCVCDRDFVSVEPF